MNARLERLQPLDGVIVVELGSRPAVHACGQLLQQLGATVVVVEDPAVTATSRPVAVVDKLSVSGPVPENTLIEELIRSADVLITSSDRDDTPQPADDTRIWCDITAFGSSGELAGNPASELLVQGYSGTASVTGRRDGPPLPMRAPLLDMEAAVYAAASIMVALRVRERTSSGQNIDIALYDVGVNALAAFLPLPFAGREATRNGNRHAILSPWNTYPTKDGWVMICAPTDDQWNRLCRIMGSPEEALSNTYSSTTGRLTNIDAVDHIISRWTTDLTLDACLSLLADGGIPSGPIVELQDLASEPNLVHREMVRRATGSSSGSMYSVPGAPIQPRGRGAGRIPAINEDAPEVEEIMADRRRSTSSESARTCGFPLHDVRVIEIGMNTVAPLAGRQLGALGADVIKIEPPRGDVNRVNAPLREDGESFIFSVSNTDKRGIVLDLSRPEDADTLWKLLTTADVVLENLKPGSLDRLGFSAEAVRSRHPEIVYCSMSGFGHDSAYAGRPALDTVIQAMSGVMASNRQESMPTKAGISISDQLGGQFGLLAVLSALHQRDRTGRGTHVDIAMQDVTAWSTQYLWNGAADLPPVEVLESADGFVLVEGLDTQDIAKRLHTDDVDAARSLGRHLSRNEILDRLNTETIPVAAPVCTLDEVLTSQQTIDRRLVISRPSYDGDTWTVLESPMRLSKTPARVRTAMARLGALDVSLHDELVRLPAAQAAARQTGADHAG